MKQGHLNDPAIQKALKGQQRKLRGWELADLETVLKTHEGRRMYYRLVFELCLLESSSFNSGIKDGVCSALHMAHLEGRRDIGRVLAQEAQAHLPDLWRLMVNERIAHADADAAERDRLTRPQETDHDN